MANIRTNPDGWQEVLDALARDDIESARQKVVKYKFDGEGLEEHKGMRKNKKKGVYIYHVVDLEGNRFTAKSGSEMDKKVGFTRGYTLSMTAKHFEPFVRMNGEYKGWTMWRERYEI